MVEDDFAHTHGLGGNLHVFVLLDVFQCLFEGEDDGGHDACLVVGTGSAHIGELLGFSHVHHEVVVVDVFAHHLSGIDFVLRVDEEAATVLQVVDGVGKGRAGFERNHGAVLPAGDVALVRLVVLEAVGHDGFALRSGEHVGTQPDDAARGDVELDVHSFAQALHGGHLALAACDHVNHL